MDVDAVMTISKRAIELCAAEGKRLTPTKTHWRAARREVVGEDWQQPLHRVPLGDPR